MNQLLMRLYAKFVMSTTLQNHFSNYKTVNTKLTASHALKSMSRLLSLINKFKSHAWTTLANASSRGITLCKFAHKTCSQIMINDKQTIKLQMTKILNIVLTVLRSSQNLNVAAPTLQISYVLTA